MFQFEVEDQGETALDGTTADSESPTCSPFNVGDRVSVGGDIGTIKYVGVVEGYSGMWLGVEWDDPERGKHNGVVGGVPYFHCPNPKGASFVRLAKAQKVRSLVEALKERYDSVILPTLKSIEDRLHKKTISYLGLKVVNLGGRDIEDLRGWEQVVSLCPNVEVLELNDNLISGWKPLLQMLKGWTRLRRFDLSRNPLIPLSHEDTVTQRDALSQLDCVVLGGVDYDWETLLALSNIWPQITTLTVPFNKMAILKAPTTTSLANLTSLDLEKNGVKEWSTVLELGRLTKLETLNLCGNHISKIHFPDSSYFPSLFRLNITENLIDNWSSVNELKKVKSLRELRMDINPILNHHERPTNRQIIIAQIENLQKLEGVEINRQERRDAELDYVKLFGKDWADETQRDLFLLEHPLYPQLSSKYGKNDKTEEKQSMKSTLLNLLIVPESSINYKECEKKILKTMTVQKLKALLQRVFKLPPVPVQITATSCRNPEISFPLDNDFVEVGQYSLEDGDTLRLRW